MVGGPALGTSSLFVKDSLDLSATMTEKRSRRVLQSGPVFLHRDAADVAVKPAGLEKYSSAANLPDHARSKTQQNSPQAMA